MTQGNKTFNLQSQSDEYLPSLPVSAGNNKESGETIEPPYMQTRTFTSHIPEERTEDFNLTPNNQSLEVLKHD